MPALRALRRGVAAALVLSLLGGCSNFLGAWSSGPEVDAQATPGSEISYDVVKVSDAVVTTLRAHQPPPFHERFKKYQPSPDIKISVGDVLSVVVWEASPEGLFGYSLQDLGGRGAREMAQAAAGLGETTSTANPALSGLVPSNPLSTTGPTPPTRPNAGAIVKSIAAGSLYGSDVDVPTYHSGTSIPDQKVGPDGTITIPYGGNVPVVGRTPAQVQTQIEQRLAGKAVEPQALVVVKQSEANSVSISGPAVPGRRVTLGVGGMRILDVIAAASGSDTAADSKTALQGLTDAQTQTLINVSTTRGTEAALALRQTALLAQSSGAIKAPVREVMVRLSRDGVTATVPLATVIADPAENIYVQPGDVLILDTRPKTFSVFGATGRNAAITFTRDKLSLSEALAQSGGLNDNVADPQAVFLFRYEPRSIVAALGQPIATRAPSGISPIAYRLDLRDPKAYLLAKEFPVHDKDIIFVAEAESQPVYRFFSALANVTGPIETGLLVCQNGNC